MSLPKNIVDFQKENASEFLNSFDNVLFDCDGVLYMGKNAIEGSQDCINGLYKLGKNIGYVTNNSVFGYKEFHEKFKKLNFRLDCQEQMYFPTRSIISYLKKINFNKELYVLCSDYAKREYESAGFQVYKYGYSEPNVYTLEFLKEKSNNDIGAVIVDVDLELTYQKLTIAQLLLANKDILFLVGAQDEIIPVTENTNILGPKSFVDILIKMTGREPKYFSKPSAEFAKTVMDGLKIKNPERTLFVGDSLSADMPFAAYCGFQKLLVLSGGTKKEDLTNFNAENYPDFIANSVNDIFTLIKNF